MIKLLMCDISGEKLTFFTLYNCIEMLCDHCDKYFNISNKQYLYLSYDSLLMIWEIKPVSAGEGQQTKAHAFSCSPKHTTLVPYCRSAGGEFTGKGPGTRCSYAPEKGNNKWKHKTDVASLKFSVVMDERKHSFPILAQAQATKNRTRGVLRISFQETI